MAGRLWFTRSGGWDGIATLDTNRLWRACCSAARARGSVTLTLNNIPAAFGSSVNVRVERVTSNGNELTAAPTLHSQQDLAVSGGGDHLHQRLPGTLGDHGHGPARRLAAQVAKPAFNPLRGTYWKPTTVTLSCATGARRSATRSMAPADRFLAGLHRCHLCPGHHDHPRHRYQSRNARFGNRRRHLHHPQARQRSLRRIFREHYLSARRP